MKLVSVANGTDTGDAVNKGQLDTVAAALGTTAEWQKSVMDRLAAPPGSPVDGSRYLIIATATGDWAGKEDQIAQYDLGTTSWIYTVPAVGTFTSADDETDGIYYYGGSWTKKTFEATTASTGLVKSGNDIRLAVSCAGDGLLFNTGVISIGSGNGITVNASDIQIDEAANLTMTGQVQLNDFRVNEAVAVTATSTELNILDGATISTSELNVLDGIAGVLDEDNMSSDSATHLVTQQSSKAYTDAAISGVSSREVEIRTLGAGDITGKGFSLTGTPAVAAEVTMFVDGAPYQQYGVAFAISGSNVTWNGYNLDSVLEIGDNVTVVFST
ncbi:MAG: DUF2793 domain-containing protein [bacterium]|nr:DUF2793 domain-containing protein [bacterium]